MIKQTLAAGAIALAGVSAAQAQGPAALAGNLQAAGEILVFGLQESAGGLIGEGVNSSLVTGTLGNAGAALVADTPLAPLDAAFALVGDAPGLDLPGLGAVPRIAINPIPPQLPVPIPQIGDRL